MPRSEISNFPSKLNCSVFTILIHGAPYFVTTLTPSFPKMLSPNHFQGQSFLYLHWSLIIPSCLSPRPLFRSKSPFSSTLTTSFKYHFKYYSSTYIFWKPNVYHLLGSRTIAGTKWDSKLVLMGFISYKKRENKQIREMRKSIKRKHFHSATLIQQNKISTIISNPSFFLVILHYPS